MSLASLSFELVSLASSLVPSSVEGRFFVWDPYPFKLTRVRESGLFEGPSLLRLT